MQEVFLAGGCVWGVQEYCRHIPGVIHTRAGRANGKSHSTTEPYDGYAESVRIQFDETLLTIHELMTELFDIIDPYSVNRQGDDTGKKYRTGIYSQHSEHLTLARAFINSRTDSQRIVVEVLPLSNFVESDLEHQDRLQRCPDDYCHIDEQLLNKHKR